MQDVKIKLKVQNKTPLKQLDKRKLYAKKLKENIVEIKQHSNYKEDNENNSINEYGVNKIEEKTNMLVHKGKTAFLRYGKKSATETIKNIQVTTQEIKHKIENRTIKNTKKIIKTVKPNERTLYKTTKQTTKMTIKNRKKAYQIANITAKATIKGIKLGIKVTTATFKALIAGTKALISAIAAGGWVAVVIIIAICLIVFICSSVLGISSESSNIVQVASSQIGNKGGQPYWSWYGYDSRVEWCACFVSWCANQCNYIETGIIPKFSNCEAGIKWFKDNAVWQTNVYIPKSRRYSFF